MGTARSQKRPPCAGHHGPERVLFTCTPRTVFGTGESCFTLLVRGNPRVTQRQRNASAPGGAAPSYGAGLTTCTGMVRRLFGVLFKCFQGPACAAAHDASRSALHCCSARARGAFLSSWPKEEAGEAEYTSKSLSSAYSTQDVGFLFFFPQSRARGTCRNTKQRAVLAQPRSARAMPPCLVPQNKLTGRAQHDRKAPKHN